MSLIQQCLVGVSGVVAKTYSEFFDHITSIGATSATGGTYITGTGTFYVGGLSAAGSMWGSTWNGYYATTDSHMNRAIQHACPTQTVWDNIVSNSSYIHMTLNSLASRSTSSIARNGYTSVSYSEWDTVSMTQLLYWDYTESKAKVVNPFAAGTPTDYIF